MEPKPPVDSQTLMASGMWAFTGALVGFGISTPVPALFATRLWVLVAASTSALGVLVGLSPILRGKVGVPVVASSFALLGYVIGFLSNIWQLGIAGILIGAVLGTLLGTKLQARYTRNTKRTGNSDFYRG